MSTNLEDVEAFHRQFGLSDERVKPGGWNDELIAYRVKFLDEELDELKQGVAERDHAQMADALIDLVYVALGTADLLNYPWQELWADVQRANMSKQRAERDGSDSKRGSGYDVIKPEGWQPPDTVGVLTNWGFRICSQCGDAVERSMTAIGIAYETPGGRRAARLFCSMAHHDAWRAARQQ